MNDYAGLKVKRYTSCGSNFAVSSVALLLIGVNYWGKTFASAGGNLLSVESIVEGLHHFGKQTGTHKKLFPYVKMVENIQEYSYILCN